MCYYTGMRLWRRFVEFLDEIGLDLDVFLVVVVGGIILFLLEGF